jgi:hypothetical protein
MANAIFPFASLRAFAVFSFRHRRNNLLTAKAQRDAKMNQSYKLWREVVGRRSTLSQTTHFRFLFPFFFCFSSQAFWISSSSPSLPM